MRRTRPPYPPEFRRQIVELARAGRSVQELAEEFEPSYWTIRTWIKQADRDDGLSANGLTSEDREELRRLRRENRQLKNGAGDPGKSRGLVVSGDRHGTQEVFGFVRVRQACYPIATMCRVLEVSTSGYYAWRDRPISARARRDAQLRARIETIHQASRATYGMPRVHAELAADGVRVGRKRVARLMSQAGLEGVSRRRRVRTTRRGSDARPVPDLVNRDFTADAPDRLWVADITYVSTWSGFLYLAIVMDAFSRRVVGWSMANHLRAELVLEALNMAIWQRRPDSVIHHSDQGTQYTSIAFGKRCRQLGVRPSTGSAQRLLRQRPGRELLRDARDGVTVAGALQEPGRSADGSVRVHRGVLQPAPSPLRARQRVPDRLREEVLRDPIFGGGNCRVHADRFAIRTATWKPLRGSHRFPPHYCYDLKSKRSTVHRNGVTPG